MSKKKQPQNSQKIPTKQTKKPHSGWRFAERRQVENEMLDMHDKLLW